MSVFKRKGIHVYGKLRMELLTGNLTRDTANFLVSMDPFAEIKIGVNHYWKSRIIKNGGKTPDFGGEGCSFEITEDNARLAEFIIWDSNSMNPDQLVGYGQFNLEEVIKNPKYKGPILLKFEGNPAGEI